jgi:hypothetical protein
MKAGCVATEGHELDRKWQVPKEMIGRRLSQAEAKRLLVKFAANSVRRPSPLPTFWWHYLRRKAFRSSSAASAKRSDGCDRQ